MIDLMSHKQKIAAAISVWIIGCTTSSTNNEDSVKRENAQDQLWKEEEIQWRDRLLDELNLSTFSSDAWSGWTAGYLADDNGVVFDVSIHARKYGLRCGDKIKSFNEKEIESEWQNYSFFTTWIKNNREPEQGLNFTVLRGDKEYEVFLPLLNIREDLMETASLLRELNWLELTRVNGDSTRPINFSAPQISRCEREAEYFEGLRLSLKERTYARQYGAALSQANAIFDAAQYSKRPLDSITPSWISWLSSQYARMKLHSTAKDIITRYNELVGREVVPYFGPKNAPARTASADQPKPTPKPIEQNPVQVSTGTGFFISDTGLIITAHHVVENAKTIEITTSSGLKIPAQYVRGSKPNDVALLQIPATARPVDSRPWIPLVSARSIDIGTDVFTMGFPMEGVLGRQIKFTDGSISAKSGIGDDQSRMQISVPLQPGNSGGPLVTNNGDVIGVISAGAAFKAFVEMSGSLPQNVNWAIKSDYAMLLLDAAPKSKGPISKSEAIKQTKSATCLIVCTQ